LIQKLIWETQSAEVLNPVDRFRKIQPHCETAS
jgi:hypothetical protein